MFVYVCIYIQQQLAGQVLTQFKENPEAWNHVDAILEFSRSQNTKFFALQILETLIKTRWKALPREQCEGWSISGNGCTMSSQ